MSRIAGQAASSSLHAIAFTVGCTQARHLRRGAAVAVGMTRVASSMCSITRAVGESSSLGRVIATARKQREKMLELQRQWLANVADERNVDLGGRSIADAAVPANDLLADISVDRDVLSKQIDFDEFVRGLGREIRTLRCPARFAGKDMQSRVRTRARSRRCR